MRIENRVLRFNGGRQENWLKTVGMILTDRLEGNTYPLRFSIVQSSENETVLEATVLCYDQSSPFADRLGEIELLEPRAKSYQGERFGVVQIIPTGIRCEFGGFAGDACPVTNLLASASDFLITHPNAVNASELNEMAPNVLYVEGKALDDFLLGHLGLLPVRSNKIGTFVDPTGIDYMDYVINTLNAARAVKGIDCSRYTVLPEEPGVRIEWSEIGAAVGTLTNPDVLLEMVEGLIAQGVDAIGGISVIHGVTREMFSRHLHGEIPNPSGGIEAIITHMISKLFRVPTAHAPLPYYQNIKEKDTSNPRASAEFISIPHYYSVLKGLARAPRLMPLQTLESVPAHLISLNDIGAVVSPASCLGGIPALAAEFSNIPLIAVRENKTILDVSSQKMAMANVIEVESYLEAAGVILALREGISLESLRRPLGSSSRLGPTKEVRPSSQLQSA